MKVTIASTSGELDKIFALRHQVLRAPWNQPYETSYDALENSSINCYVEDEKGETVACGRLQENEHRTGQIRYMAVHPARQGKGFGKMVLKRLEQEAVRMGLQKIELQARENAVKFYEMQGYTIKEKTFLLFDAIQHYKMEKTLLSK